MWCAWWVWVAVACSCMCACVTPLEAERRPNPRAARRPRGKRVHRVHLAMLATDRLQLDHAFALAAKIARVRDTDARGGDHSSWLLVTHVLVKDARMLAAWQQSRFPDSAGTGTGRRTRPRRWPRWLHGHRPQPGTVDRTAFSYHTIGEHLSLDAKAGIAALGSSTPWRLRAALALALACASTGGRTDAVPFGPVR